jgi:hypothetical protein
MIQYQYHCRVLQVERKKTAGRRDRLLRRPPSQTCVIVDSEVETPVVICPEIREDEAAFQRRCEPLVLEYLNGLGRQGWGVAYYLQHVSVHWPGLVTASQSHNGWPWGTLLLARAGYDQQNSQAQVELQTLRRKAVYLGCLSSLVVATIGGLLLTPTHHAHGYVVG